MKKNITPAAAFASGVEEAWRDIGTSFKRFCLSAGIATLADMMERDAADLCGPRCGREDDRCGHRWGQAAGKLGFHGGKMPIERVSRVRARDGPELALPSWPAAQAEHSLGRQGLILKAGRSATVLERSQQKAAASIRLSSPARSETLVASVGRRGQPNKMTGGRL